MHGVVATGGATARAATTCIRWRASWATAKGCQGWAAPVQASQSSHWFRCWLKSLIHGWRSLWRSHHPSSCHCHCSKSSLKGNGVTHLPQHQGLPGAPMLSLEQVSGTLYVPSAGGLWSSAGPWFCAPLWFCAPPAWLL